MVARGNAVPAQLGKPLRSIANGGIASPVGSSAIAELDVRNYRESAGVSVS